MASGEEKEAQCARADALRGWVEEVAAEAGVDDLGALFCGYHSGTLPSLVLREGGDDGEDGDLSALQGALLRIAKPLAVQHSPSLRAAPGGDRYFETHASLKEVAAARHRPSEAARPCRSAETSPAEYYQDQLDRPVHGLHQRTSWAGYPDERGL